MASTSSTLVSFSRSTDFTTTAPATSMTGSPATQPSSIPGYKDGVSPIPIEAIIGIVIGAVAGLAVLIAIIIFFVRRAAMKTREERGMWGDGGKRVYDTDDESAMVWEGDREVR
ncbi:hypothetical protein COCMIDRAFT_24662 [Bipolaris oryzae ATCC 44560]|uniref:Mid2 domain-containing protein n=1 Tax=Bipolaris oryzae ATCC 44560 TaxID=930090 RepID=W6Z6Y3_COCMI|nr:uncharacterized protein COCMIDRAFT_24662 [Bipolaris oryzae ATCC 44560]EUC47502.1 hypothetical protein COCMIDRAFT_24662 [Bipolaris oryzae ATCC 44560]